MKTSISFLTALVTLAATIFASGVRISAAEPQTPTHANVSYGPHSRNVLDFWKAEGAGPLPEEGELIRGILA